MPSQTVNGVALSYTDRGPARSSVPLVLLHGFPVDSRMWDRQVADLSDRVRVVAPDHRGFGKSAPGGPFTIESLADDAHALLAALGSLPCVLVGLSMGGYVALAFAKKYPSDLAGLALVDTRADADTPEAKAGRGKMAELARTKGAAAVADQMLPRLVAPDTLAHRPDVVRRLRDMMEATPPATIEHALYAMGDRPDLTGLLPDIKVPTLVVVGDADAITPMAVAEGMQRAIPNATLAVIRGSGHMSPMEQPTQVSQALRRFLDGL